MGCALRWWWLALLFVVSCGRTPTPPDTPSELLEHLRRQFPAMATRLRADLPPAAQPSPHPGLLKPAEQHALDALARRDAGWLDARSPTRADQPLRIFHHGVTLEVRAVGAAAVARHTSDGVAVYREAYRDTDVLQVPGKTQHEELLYLKNTDAPTRFEYAVRVHGGTLRGSGEVVDAQGEVRLRLARPLATDAQGRVVAARLEIGGSHVVVALDAEGLRYPVLLDPTWQTGQTGMAQGRFDHTLSLLGDGRILACGGTVDEATPLASCEVLNPDSGQWSFVASMPTPRMRHTATTMANGKVLACGGGTAACEEYDPWHDTWTATPPMVASRSGHTATLLRTGKVLVVGGDASGTAQLYDSSTRAWSDAGTIAARSGATATLLGDGRVLVVGGMAGDVPSTAVDLYDPAGNSWSAGPALSEARAEHTATRTRDGQVLVAGGTSDGSTPLASVVLFDEGTESWSPTASLTGARRRHMAALTPWGEVLVAGGRGTSGVLGSTEAYTGVGVWRSDQVMDQVRERAGAVVTVRGVVVTAGGRSASLAVGAWEGLTRLGERGLFGAVSPMVSMRQFHTATLLQTGQVLVAGGYYWDGGGALTSAELYDPASGTWSAAAPMSAPRYRHTATLLGTGHVLITGGLNFDGDLTSTEVYDPGSGTWSPVAPMGTKRHWHTATLLGNGTVLAAGGYNSGTGYLKSAEVYDPAGDTWSPVTSMASSRAAHTATLLANGRVLVAGGVELGILASAEVYNPATGTWATVGTMTSPRDFHTATLLQNGQVLVAGGYGGGLVASAEVYTPASGTWTTVGPMITRRSHHTATLLPEGKVLVAGGESGNALATVEVFDPATGNWSTVAPMGTTRSGHTATLLATGRILIAAGTSGTPPAHSEEYDPGPESWSGVGSLAASRNGHTATLLGDGRVLVAGGYNGSPLANAEIYDPGVGTWTAVAPLTTERTCHTATLLGDGRVLVAGGANFVTGYLASAEVYDPVAESWTTVAPLAAARQRHTATLLESGKVLVAGGAAPSTYLASAEVYDPVTESWTTVASMASPRECHTATRLPNGQVLVAGGYYYGGAAHHYLAGTEVYDPTAESWTTVAPLAAARQEHSATLLGSGHVLVAGGEGPGGSLASVEVYDPVAGSWTTVAPMATARNEHSATPLGLGQVLIAGGISPAGIVASVEVYDPGSGSWTTVAPMATPRKDHTATLLASGLVLVGSGQKADYGYLATAEVFDPGVDVAAAWRPTVDVPATVFAPGGALALTGARLRGGHESSGGVTAGGAADLPSVLVTGIGSGVVHRVAPSTFSDTSLTFTVPAGQGYEQVLVRVITAGLLSAAVPVALEPGAPDRPAGQGGACAVGTGCLTGNCVDGVCCATAACGDCEGCAEEHHVGTCAPLALGADDTEPADTCTGTHTCNGAGACLLKNGQVCDPDASSCASGLCADGVCCDAACGETCRSCDVTGHEGACFDVPAGLPDNGCTTPGEACDGAGACKKGLGVGCSDGGECASTYCIDGVCCDDLCNTTCWSCGVPGAVGTCSATPQYGIDAPGCLGVYACDGAGTCKLANGQLAGDGDDCASGVVADDVCCENACTGLCRSCDQSGYGGSCRPYGLGTDPEGECTGETGCEGACNGLGDCTWPGNEATCGSQSCTGATLAFPDRCDGAGHCADSGTALCTGGYVCDATGTVCRSDCTIQDDCQPGFFCDPGTSTCKAQSANGTACSQGYECASESCADGYCCATPCIGACDECATTPGTCKPLAQGSAGTPSCTPYLCDGVGATCPTTCDDFGDCTAGFYCGGGACLAKKTDGVACGAGSECQSGFCADGVCCDGACADRCRSCAMGGYVGQCRFYAQGEDPDSECGTDATCGGTCDGLGACVFPGSSRECAAQSCAGFTLTRAGSCDGAGGCDVPAAEACGNGYVCNAAGTGCESTCVTSDDCQDGYYCDPANGTCRGQATNGAACDRDSECASGFCVEGECCEAASCGGFACEGGTCRTSCVRDDQCAATWVCEVLTGTCQAPAGTACDSDDDCQSGTCAGGYCCGEPCAGDDPTCGGSCDDTGTCSYPHDGRACTCGDGTSSVCAHGVCARGASGSDGGSGPAPGDAGVGAEPGEGGGCSLAGAGTTTTGGLLALLLTLLAARRRRGLD